MSHDPVTNSMLSEKDQKYFQNAPSSFDAPPDIDLFNLDLYTEAALRQTILDLRIKRARINHEVAQLEKVIQNFQRERQHVLSRQAFYQDLTEFIETYFEKEAPCPTNEPATAPETSSLQ